jgi:hypothetical protein
MQKIIRYSLYLSILLFYNLTTLYTSVVHDHQFSWTEEESCSAYVISISQNSDTFTFSINQLVKTPDVDLLDFQSYDKDLSFEFINIFSERAPPYVI